MVEGLWDNLNVASPPRCPFRLRAVAAIASVFALGGCSASAQSDEARVDCITRLRVPRYSQVAQSARMQPELRVSLRIGSDGQSATYDVDSPPPGFQYAFAPELEKTARLSRYSPACAGQTVHLVFRFQMDGAFGDAGDLVWFERPNRFTVTATPPLINTKQQ